MSSLTSPTIDSVEGSSAQYVRRCYLLNTDTQDITDIVTLLLLDILRDLPRVVFLELGLEEGDDRLENSTGILRATLADSK